MPGQVVSQRHATRAPNQSWHLVSTLSEESPKPSSALGRLICQYVGHGTSGEGPEAESA